MGEPAQRSKTQREFRVPVNLFRDGAPHTVGHRSSLHPGADYCIKRWIRNSTFRTRKFILLAGASAALAFAGCGGDSTTTVIQTTAPEETTSASTLSEDDQQALNMLLGASPDDLAEVCEALNQGYSRSQAYDQGIESLTKVILRAGGEPSVVVNALLDEC